MACSLAGEPQQSSIVVQESLAHPSLQNANHPHFNQIRINEFSCVLAFHPISELSKHVFD
jgi:hypothetical protein